MMTGVPGRRVISVTAAAFITALTAHAADASGQTVVTTAATLNSRVLLGAAALLVTGLLFLLYFYRPRLYIRYWVLAWILAAASPLLLAHRYTTLKAVEGIYGLSQFVGVLSSLVFVLSADAYRTKPR